MKVDKFSVASVREGVFRILEINVLCDHRTYCVCA